MSRVIHTGSDNVLHSRKETEQRLLAKVKANTGARIGTELELFVTTPDGAPISFKDIQRLFANIAEAAGDVVKGEEEGNTVALHIPDLGDVCLEPGGQVELSTKPCDTMQELEDANFKLRQLLDRAASSLGFVVKGQGHMPSFMTAEDMPRSRFKAYYRYCHHEIGRAADDLIQTMKSVCSLQVNVDPMGEKFHEIYRSLLLTDVAAAFNGASQRQERLHNTYDPFFGEQTEPVFAALSAQSNEELIGILVDRLLTLKVPFIPDQSAEGFASSIDLFGNPPTVEELLKKGLLTEEILDNALSLQLTPPNLRRHGVLETRLQDSVDTVDDVMRVARKSRNAAYNEAERHRILKRFKDIDPDLLKVAFNARCSLPKDKLMKLPIGKHLTVRDLVEEPEGLRHYGLPHLHA